MTTEPGGPGRFGERAPGWHAGRRTPEGRRSRREILSRRRPGAWPVAAASLGAFFAAGAFLAGQMRDGGDPALGAGRPATPPRARVVVVRRVIRTTVVHHPRRARSGATSSALPSPSEASAEQNAPAAPAPAAPAPAAPAPATPAPLTTQSS